MIQYVILGHIDNSKSRELYNYFDSFGIGLTGLFNRVNADTELIERSNVIQIPVKYIYYLQENYDRKLISYEVLEKALSKINKRPIDYGFTNHSEDVVDDFNTDDELRKLLNKFILISS